MSEQEQYDLSKHESVSNVPEEPSELGVSEGERVSEEPFGGEGSEAGQEGQMGAEELFELLSDPTLSRTAPNTAGLPYISEASFGRLQPGGNPSPYPVVEESLPSTQEIVIGTDDRIQVTNTSAFPWRVHASLRITAKGGALYKGTGWFIGPHTLVTAGHCVFIHAPGTSRHGWVQSIQVMPGRNGASLPYGSVTSTAFRAVSGWTEDADQAYDYGAIIIPTELGNTVGFFGFGVFPDSELRASTVCISGYPGDKSDGTQWYHCRQVASVSPSKVYYDADTAGGQSGSAVYRITDGKYYGVAVHAYGGSTSNNGTRIVQSVYDNLVAWKA